MFHALLLLMLVPWLIGDRTDAAEKEDSPRDSPGRSDETAEARLYGLAAAQGGTLTVSDVVVARGAPRFEFPELMGTQAIVTSSDR